MSTSPTNFRSFGNKSPDVALTAYIDDYAMLIGDVTVMDNAMVWPGALIRADDAKVIISENSAILDRAFIEAPAGKPVLVGKSSIISHGALLHGAKVGDECLIGIGAILLDGCVVGNRCIVAAGSLVPPGKVIEDNSIVMGTPAKFIKNTSEDDILRLSEELKTLTEKAKTYISGSLVVSEDIKNLPKLKKKRKVAFREISFGDV